MIVAAILGIVGAAFAVGLPRRSVEGRDA